MYTAFALLTHIDSQSGDLLFPEFRLHRLDSVGDLDDARSAFPSGAVRLGQWLYTRTYDDVVLGSFGFGRIPVDLEDTLLLLRLFRIGDIAIVRHSVRGPNGGISAQYPQRAMVDIASVHPYRFQQADCDAWQIFASELKLLAAWQSAWFRTARRFFLYGGAKEFNPEFDEVDRVVDYVIALEASLVPERGYGIGRRLSQRATRLLGIQGDEAKTTSAVLSKFYGVRSSIVHGSAINKSDTKTLAQMDQLESLVRLTLVAALRTLPPDDETRRRVLVGLFDVSDVDRFAEAVRIAKQISSRMKKLKLLYWAALNWLRF